MSQWTIIMKVDLGANHLRPGRTRHTITDVEGKREFPPFIRLELAQFTGDQGYYLLHISEDHSIADTWHSTLEEAIHQAEWEFGVQQSEWHAVPSNESRQDGPAK